MADDIILTPSGKRKIEEELEHLRSTEMPALSERIRQARALGDLSENFDYQDSKRQQGFIAGRIADLSAMLERAKIVEESIGGDSVGLGCTVALRDLDYDDEITYTLVDPISADPSNDKISLSSPVGKALMGAKVGQTIEVTTPGGNARYEVLSIG
jgi:transcription elongation factor GreA